MERKVISKKEIIIATVVSLIILCVVSLGLLIRPAELIIFCDVGQGDASYIRLKNGVDILIDAGGDKRAAICLGKHMPLYDRTIELAILTHPDHDHYGGFAAVLEHYHIRHMLMPGIDNEAISFKQLYALLVKSNTVISYPRAGDTIPLTSGEIRVLWPTELYVKTEARVENGSPLLQPIAERNAFSIICLVMIHGETVLYTGDASPDVLNAVTIPGVHIDVLKVPHHGSTNGLTEEFLRRVAPETAVISVGKDNSYGHPSPEVLQLLTGKKTVVERTDLVGDITFELPTKKAPGPFWTRRFN